MINVNELTIDQLNLIRGVSTVDNYESFLKKLCDQKLIYYNHYKKRYCIWNTTLNIQMKKTIPIDQNLEAAANAMISLYPKGNKPYTSSSWRGNKMEVIQKLARLRELTNEDFDVDLLEKATKKYIESFNGDYTFMRTLPYFILKRTIDNGTFTYRSDLLSVIENIKNPGNESLLPHEDWIADLK